MKNWRILIYLILIVLAGVMVFYLGRGEVLHEDRYLYENGTYRGIFADGDEIQVNVEFELEDGIVQAADFRWLRRDENYNLEAEDDPYRSVVQQYKETLEYLEGKELKTYLTDLYFPENFVETEVDDYTAATIRSQKVISAIRDALNRGVYSKD